MKLWIRCGMFVGTGIGLVCASYLPVGVDFPHRGEVTAGARAVVLPSKNRDSVAIEITTAMTNGAQTARLGDVIEFHGIEISRTLDCSYSRIMSVDPPVTAPAHARQVPLALGRRLELCLN